MSCSSRHLPQPASSQQAQARMHVRSRQASRGTPPYPSCKHHAPNTSANAHPLLVPLHTQAPLATPSSPCRAPSRAVLTTGTTAPLTTTATTTTTDTPNDMTTATMNHHATDAATTDTTTNIPNEATTIDTTTATQSHRTARGGGIATTRPPPTQTNHTTPDGAHTHLHPAALARANPLAEKRRRKSPSSTTWAKPPSSSA
jgi:hypothetical protein